MTDDVDHNLILPGRGTIATLDTRALSKHGDALVFEYEDAFGQPAQGFLLRVHDLLVAYENRCPHWSVPIDQEDGSFLDRNRKSVIICPMHGANFDPHTGECTIGPCRGQHLRKFDVIELEHGRVTIRAARPSLTIPS